MTRRRHSLCKTLIQLTFASAMLIQVNVHAEAQENPRQETYYRKYFRWLKQGNETERRKAAYILGYIGIQGAPAALAEALADKDTLVRATAAASLRRIGPAAAVAVPKLADALSDSDVMVRYYAAMALGSIGEQAKFAVPALALALKDPDEDVSSSAAWALGMIGDAGATAPLLLQLEAKNRLLRLNAAAALWKITRREAVLQIVIDDLNNPDEYIRALSAQILSRNASTINEKVDTGVIVSLTKALADKDFGVRFSAAEAIGAFGKRSKDAFPALLEMYRKGTLDPAFLEGVLKIIDPDAAAKAGLE
jgi:HEAT repeat protein